MNRMDLRMRDMRNPYGSEGGYVMPRRSRRSRRDRAMRDRGMDYGYDGRNYRSGDYEYDSRRSDRAYSEQDNARNRRDYESGRQSDMARGDYGDMRDMHYGERQGNFRPIEAMGYFTGYYGGNQDYAGDMARGGRDSGYGMDYGYDYNYDMGYDYARRGGRRDYGDYNYGMRDYAGDYGENLTQQELEHWRKKLDKEVGDEQSKQFFKKENIEQKARQMGIEMKHFNAEELALASYMLYSDYCKSMKPYVGQNMDVFVKMGEEFLNDPDSAVKGGEKLALYYEIVAGEED